MVIRAVFVMAGVPFYYIGVLLYWLHNQNPSSVVPISRHVRTRTQPKKMMLFLSPPTSPPPPTPPHPRNVSRGPDPTNNSLLTNFWLSSDAEIFVINRRPSMQVGAELAKNARATCAYSDWASILRATTVGGWAPMLATSAMSLRCRRACILRLKKIVTPATQLHQRFTSSWRRRVGWGRTGTWNASSSAALVGARAKVLWQLFCCAKSCLDFKERERKLLEVGEDRVGPPVSILLLRVFAARFHPLGKKGLGGERRGDTQPTTLPWQTSSRAPMQKFLLTTTGRACESGAKRAKDACATCACSDWASHFACHRWWLGRRRRDKEKF